MKLVYLIASSVCIAAKIVTAGECCRAYDNGLIKESAKYCADYCCGSHLLLLECCDNFLLQAPSSDRSSFCLQWFFSPQNVWAPILMGLAFVGCIVGCCCCCYQGCKPQTRTTTVMPQPGFGGGTTVITGIPGQTVGYPGHYPQPGQGPAFLPGAGYNQQGPGQQLPGAAQGSHPDSGFQKT